MPSHAAQILAILARERDLRAAPIHRLHPGLLLPQRPQAMTTSAGRPQASRSL